MEMRAIGRRGWAALAMVLVTLGAHAQERLGKGEALVRLHAIPLSKPMEFAQFYTEDEVELMALLATQQLDASASWNSASVDWNLYRINLRMELERTLTSRLTRTNGTLRTLSQTPGTSLAQHYADTLSEAELDQAIQFMQSAVGRKYVTYQRMLRAAYARGRLVFAQMRVDPSIGPNRTNADLQALWLARHRLPAGTGEQSYEFHVRTLQPLYPTVSPQDLAFNLAAGAVPGSPAMRMLDAHFSTDERAEVTRYLESQAAARELVAIRSWATQMSRQPDLLPLALGELASYMAVVEQWRAARGRPETLPRSAVRVDQAALEIPASLEVHTLDSSIRERILACQPKTSERVLSDFEDFVRKGEVQRFSRALLSVSEPTLYVTRGNQGACLKTTAPGFPLIAADSLAGTVIVVGMTDEETLNWRRRIAAGMAATGSSTTLVMGSAGNAFEINYAFDPRSPHRYVYYMRFRPAGTFAESDYAVVMRPASMRSVIVAQTVASSAGAPVSRVVLSSPLEKKRDEEERMRP